MTVHSLHDASLRHHRFMRRAQAHGYRAPICDGMESAYRIARWLGARVSGFSGKHCTMRLTQEQTRQIARTVHRYTDEGVEIFLFGSRLDDSARGGDVDLLLEISIPLGFIQRAQIKMELEASLGLPVDIVQHVRGVPPTPFQAIAKARAVRLDARA